MTNVNRHPASFRDPSGFLFRSNGLLYRQVNKLYQPHYELLMQSGLYQKLVSAGQLVPHQELEQNLQDDPEAWKTLQPELLPYISYPYEWSFDMLREAGLLTLSIMRKAMEQGMILKDASAFNVQFRNHLPVFIDTLSFEKYDEQKPWVAYRQFCEHFLYPLYLEHYCGVDAISWLRQYINGIPGEITARLLPYRSRWNLGVRLHVLLQQSVTKKKTTAPAPTPFSRQKLTNLLLHLESILKSLKPGYPPTTTWSNYYEGTILGKDYLAAKEKVMEGLLSRFHNTTVLDLGANDGFFSQLAAQYQNQVIAADFDAQCINTLFLNQQKSKHPTILPLVMDLSNPSPALGFAHQEREDWLSRTRVELVMALALIHHLVIGKNISLEQVAGWMARFAPQLIIEFVPKTDEKVKGMLAGREDVFSDYTTKGFEERFLAYFSIEEKHPVEGTDRVIYYMKRK